MTNLCKALIVLGAFVTAGTLSVKPEGKTGEPTDLQSGRRVIYEEGYCVYLHLF